jgi:hypothetical protein
VDRAIHVTREETNHEGARETKKEGERRNFGVGLTFAYIGASKQLDCDIAAMLN